MSHSRTDIDSCDSGWNFKANMAADKDLEQSGELSAQISQLQGSMEQMREGLVRAMAELALSRDSERRLQRQVDSDREAADRRMELLADSVQTIQSNLAAVLVKVQRNSKATERLGQQYRDLRKEAGRTGRKLSQNEDPAQNGEREHQRKKSLPRSTKSDSGNGTSAGSHSPRTRTDANYRRRKSTPAAFATSPQPSGTPAGKPRMAPMMKPFMDSLPGPDEDLDHRSNGSKDVGFDLPNGTAGRQSGSRSKDRSPTSSDNDPVEVEQLLSHSGRRVSFISTLQQRHNSVDNDESQRSHLAEDFLLSERKYVGQLNALLENIMLPLVTESMIHASDMNLIFPPCLAKMFDRHCCLLCALETRGSDAKWQGMHGDIFAKFVGVESANFESHYGSYINTFPEALSLLSHHTRKSAKLSKFLKKQLADIEDEQADLLGYLLAPIQRIPAYVLHLQMVLEHTPSDHPDHFHVESCLSHLGHFLADMNSAIEEAVEAARVNKLFLSISSDRSSHDDEGTSDNGPDGFHGTWRGSPTKQRSQKSELLITHGQGYRRHRRASFPDFPTGHPQRERAGVAHGAGSAERALMMRGSSLGGRWGEAGWRRGSYDQRMPSETQQGRALAAASATAAVGGYDPRRPSAGIPGMMYIAEQTGSDAEPASRVPAPAAASPSGGRDRHRLRSARREGDSESARYRGYGEDDSDAECRYDPSSRPPAPGKRSGARRPAQQRSTSYERGLSSLAPCDLPDEVPTSQDDSYGDGSPRGQVVFDESEVDEPPRRDRTRSTSARCHEGGPMHEERPHSNGRVGSASSLQQQQQQQQPAKSKRSSRKRAASISHQNRVGSPEAAKPVPQDVWNESSRADAHEESLATPRAKQKAAPRRSSKEGSSAAPRATKKANFLKSIFSRKGSSSNNSRKRESCVVELGNEELANDGDAGEHEPGKTVTYRDEDGQPCSNV